jgi:hypothetical protein
MSRHEHPAALFTLIVRLDGRSVDAAAPQLAWQDCATLHWHGRTRPHKAIAADAPYFNPHIQSLLLPPIDGDDPDARRWVCAPADLHLELTLNGADREPGRARVDLLERLTLPLERDRSVGLIHLSLGTDAVDDARDLLRWNRALRGYRPWQSPTTYALTGDLSTTIDGTRPVRGLVEALFGDPADDLDRRLFVVAATADPAADAPGVDPGRDAAWRRALATCAPGRWDSDAQCQAGLAANVSLGGGQGIVIHATRAGFSRPGGLDGNAVRNLRSYWIDCLLVGLLQHDRLEDLQAELAQLGRAPGSNDLAELHRRWLAFRNVVWWSQLSRTSAMPQRLLEALRAQLGTDEMFRELEGDFGAYVEHDRQTRAEEQALALGRLQYVGAGIATTGTIATVAPLLGDDGWLNGGLAALAIAAGLAVGGVVRGRLNSVTSR